MRSHEANGCWREALASKLEHDQRACGCHEPVRRTGNAWALHLLCNIKKQVSFRGSALAVPTEANVKKRVFRELLPSKSHHRSRT